MGCNDCAHYAKSYAFGMRRLLTRHYCCCEPTAMSEFISHQRASARGETSPEIRPSWTTTTSLDTNPVATMDCPRWMPVWELP